MYDSFKKSTIPIKYPVNWFFKTCDARLKEKPYLATPTNSYQEDNKVANKLSPMTDKEQMRFDSYSKPLPRCNRPLSKEEARNIYGVDKPDRWDKSIQIRINSVEWQKLSPAEQSTYFNLAAVNIQRNYERIKWLEENGVRIQWAVEPEDLETTSENMALF